MALAATHRFSTNVNPAVTHFLSIDLEVEAADEPLPEATQREGQVRYLPRSEC